MSSLLVDYNDATMVMTVSLNRPSRGNALSVDLIEQLLELVRGVTSKFESVVMNVGSGSIDGASPLVRVFVLTGVGKIFCSGMDLKAAASSSPGVNATESMVALLDAIRALPMPSVLLLNGPALGGGTVFAFVVDFVFAIRDAYLQMSEVKIGLLPAMISCFIVPRIGTAQAGAMMLSGRRYYVDEWRAGSGGGGIALVSSDANDAEQLRSVAARFIEEHLLTSSSFSSAHMKRLIAHVATHEHADNCRVARAAFETVFASEDMQYGLQCFAKKTKPNWTNQMKAKL